MALDEIKGYRGAEGPSGDIRPKRGQRAIEDIEYCRGGKNAIEGV
jgi:hypothetical protein